MDGSSDSSDITRLRRTVLGEVAVVVLGTAALEAANLRWHLTDLVPGKSLLGHVLFVLAVSHLLMLVFGARRGRELKQAFGQRQAVQAELRHRATHDAVTGLVNRESLQAAVRAAVRPTSGRTSVALVRVRLRGLQEVAATLGHDVRDELLAAVARRLSLAVRDDGRAPGAVLASVQSEEYAVLLPGADEGTARGVAAALLAGLHGPVDVGPAQLEVRAVAGVAVVDRSGEAGDLLGRADVALHVAATGPSDVVVYRPDDDRRDPRLLNLHGELRRGIAAGELRVHHQPKVDMRTGRVTGVEALVRWQHPTRGLLPPAAFLGLAEQSGLVRELTVAVLHAALRDHVAWAASGRTLAVAVNLSARSLADDALADQVGGLLATYGVDPSQLELEVTESVAVQDPQLAMAVLGALRAAGVRVSVDDYGTGHSSLTYLSHLPLTTLKIDRSFVMGMESSSRDLTIVRSTIELAHGLGHRVVAEGVETERAWQWLQTLGCDDAQGFWLARPTPADDVLRCVQGIEDRLSAAAVLPR